MKPAIIRFLTLTSFLIFMLPFVQMCSTNMHKVPTQPEDQDSSAINKNTKDPDEEIYRSFFYTEKSNNAYELGIYTFGDVPKLHELNAFFFYLCYTLIIILSVIIAVKVFISRYKAVHWFAIANIILLLLSVILHYSTGGLEYWWQIKYGYYLFLINTLCITLLAKSILKFLEHKPE